MKDVLVDTDGFNQYYEELNRLKDISLSIASIGSESYADAVGDGWHDNFAFEDTMRESRKIASRINKMLDDEKYLKIVDKKSNSDDIIDIGDIIKIKVIYDIDDIEEYTIKLTGKYMIDNNAKIKEVSLNSPIGRSIYLKNINDNDTHYYVNDKKIGIKIINKIL
jgi:transcription elongation GreA/GreB family factor